MNIRYAARVIVLDHAGRVLLVKGHDADQPERSWWFTIGGGLENNETFPQAAVRELFEEAGIVLTEQDLQGPVCRRSEVFDFVAQPVTQHEEFFVVRVDSHVELTHVGWTELEQRVLDEMSWLTVQQIRESPIEVFPRQLADLVEHVHNGWDGITRNFGATESGIHIR
ncbi:NUDIX hydrolase [Timonella sp. A28]|uniref:NUDIX hydrolase n=1 Tax=Timonella sp. A28 TaxID=3442640 RepID=UPI003EBCF5CA